MTVVTVATAVQLVLRKLVPVILENPINPIRFYILYILSWWPDISKLSILSYCVIFESQDIEEILAA